jgi:hypothetical protein
MLDWRGAIVHFVTTKPSRPDRTGRSVLWIRSAARSNTFAAPTGLAQDVPRHQVPHASIARCPGSLPPSPMEPV